MQHQAAYCRGRHKDYRGQAMSTRQSWVMVFVMMAVLLFISTVPGHTDRGEHGYKGHEHRGHWHKGHRHGGWLALAGYACSSALGSWCPSGRTGGHAGSRIPIPQSWSRQRHGSISNLPCPRPSTGIIVTPRKRTTPMSRSAQGAGGLADAPVGDRSGSRHRSLTRPPCSTPCSPDRDISAYTQSFRRSVDRWGLRPSC